MISCMEHYYVLYYTYFLPEDCHLDHGYTDSRRRACLLSHPRINQYTGLRVGVLTI